MHDTRNDAVNTVAILGAGLIGSGWAARCLAHGRDVVAWDPNPAAEQGLRANIDNAWPALEEVGLDAAADRTRLRFVSSVAECVAGADFVQENAPDREDLKRTLLAEADRHAPVHAIIASSSSGIRPTLIARDCAHPERVVIGHPFNPVYLLPLVEVVAGEQTGPEAVQRAARFYRDIGMRPLHVRREIDGYLSDRIQQTIFHEALYMVRDGVCTPAELDAAITGGPGLRWPMLGPCLTWHLAGGPGGMRHAMEHWSPEEGNLWTHLPSPPYTPELIDAMAAGCEQMQGGRELAEIERRRDKCLIAIQRALDEFWFPRGEDGWPEMPD